MTSGRVEPTRSRTTLRRTLVALDLAMIAFAMVAARVSSWAAEAERAPLGWIAVFAGLVVLSMALAGCYRPRFVLHFLDDLRAIAAATAIAAMGVTFARLVTADEPEVASQSARLWLFTAVYMAAGRGAYGLIRARARRKGGWGDATLIIGAGAVGHSIARRLLDRPEFGLRPVAFLDDDPLAVELSAELPVIRPGVAAGPGTEAGLERLTEVVRERRIEHVIVAFSRASHADELAMVRRCTDLGASVSLVPRLFEGVPDQTSLERLGGIPLISVYPSDPRAWQVRVKYALDRAVAAIVVVLIAPVLVIAALAALASVGRPILFRQERVGLDGRPFQMLKFRTMRGSPAAGGEADADWAVAVLHGSAAAAPAVATDDRSTAVGSVLRRTGIDELPQLFNVLKGEMSLVGPRPERRAYVELFERTVRRYDERHRVKAGITGWAQVHGLRGKTSLQDRVEWDNYYVENWSPWLDLKIVMLTVRALFRAPGS